MHRPEAVARYTEELQDEIAFYRFMQFLFFRQWNALRGYAKEKGVAFIGDIPIYVAMDAADVWSEPQYFQLDEENMPVEVA
ncbi:MAG: 4-alpha-glucanotransferase, partial [Clostridia bacterium]|nr:4-alpha-glucanotransferase [Clostridia bacterium]